MSKDYQIKSISSFQTIYLQKKQNESSQNVSARDRSGMKNTNLTDDIIPTVSFENSILEVSVNCRRVKTDCFSYKRHYLIADIEQDQCQKIVQCYFDHLEIGDLVKFINARKNKTNINSKKWIQKTRNNQIHYTIKNFNQNKSCCYGYNIVSILNSIAKQSVKYNNLVQISIFVRKLSSQSLIKDIEKQLSYPINTNSYKIFYMTDKSESQSYLKQSNLDIQYLRSKTVSRQISTYFQGLKNVRLSNLKIMLQPMEGSFMSKISQTTNWVETSNSLVKYITSLNGHSYYSQKVKITNIDQELKILIQICYTKTNGDVKQLQGCFNIVKSKEIYQPRSIQNSTRTEQRQFFDSQKNSSESIEVFVYSKAQNAGGQI